MQKIQLSHYASTKLLLCFFVFISACSPQCMAGALGSKIRTQINANYTSIKNQLHLKNPYVIAALALGAGVCIYDFVLYESARSRIQKIKNHRIQKQQEEADAEQKARMSVTLQLISGKAPDNGLQIPITVTNTIADMACDMARGPLATDEVIALQAVFMDNSRKISTGITAANTFYTTVHQQLRQPQFEHYRPYLRQKTIIGAVLIEKNSHTSTNINVLEHIHRQLQQKGIVPPLQQARAILAMSQGDREEAAQLHKQEHARWEEILQSTDFKKEVESTMKKFDFSQPNHPTNLRTELFNGYALMQGDVIILKLYDGSIKLINNAADLKDVEEIAQQPEVKECILALVNTQPIKTINLLRLDRLSYHIVLSDDHYIQFKQLRPDIQNNIKKYYQEKLVISEVNFTRKSLVSHCKTVIMYMTALYITFRIYRATGYGIGQGLLAFTGANSSNPVTAPLPAKI